MGRISIAEEFDHEFVREAISARGFDPVPIREREPEAVVFERRSLTVETYSWGRVFFARDRAARLGCTWLEVKDEERSELPGWANTLRRKLDRPPCFGWHDQGNSECDGRPGPPCAFRERCFVVQKLAKLQTQMRPETRAAKIKAATEAHTDQQLDALREKFEIPSLKRPTLNDTPEAIERWRQLLLLALRLYKKMAEEVGGRFTVAIPRTKKEFCVTRSRINKTKGPAFTMIGVSTADALHRRFRFYRILKWWKAEASPGTKTKHLTVLILTTADVSEVSALVGVECNLRRSPNSTGHANRIDHFPSVVVTSENVDQVAVGIAALIRDQRFKYVAKTDKANRLKRPAGEMMRMRDLEGRR